MFFFLLDNSRQLFKHNSYAISLTLLPIVVLCLDRDYFRPIVMPNVSRYRMYLSIGSIFHPDVSSDRMYLSTFDRINVIYQPNVHFDRMYLLTGCSIFFMLNIYIYIYIYIYIIYIYIYILYIYTTYFVTVIYFFRNDDDVRTWNLMEIGLKSQGRQGIFGSDHPVNDFIYLY